MSDNICYEDLAAYVDHHRLVASNALATAENARAEFGEVAQALADIGSRMLNGESGGMDQYESERINRLIKGARAFKQIRATVASA